MISCDILHLCLKDFCTFLLQNRDCSFFSSAQCFQFFYRLLKHFFIFDMHFSWKCKAVLPSIFQRQVCVFLTIRHSHPTDVDPASILTFKTLRCIIIKSIVPEFIVRKHILGKDIPLYQKISGLVHISCIPHAAFQPLHGSR